MSGSGKQIYCFADVEIDPLRGCLTRNGEEIYLRPRTLQVLIYLIEQRERLVTKEELMETIWKNTAVTDDALVQCVGDIRRALKDDPHRPQFVKTFPKIGYHFISPEVEVRSELHASAATFILETEDITSVEVEFEQVSDDQTRRHGYTETRRPLLSAISMSPRLRVTLVSTIALALVTATASFFYLRHRSALAQRQLATVSLPPAPGKKALVVMYFENQSNSPDLDWLREGLADMLIADLSRAQKLTVLSRQQLYLLIERSGHKQTDKLQLDEALEIAHKSQADVIVLGSFARLGEKIRIDVQLHDARDGQSLTTESFIADQPDQILSQVDLLSLKLVSDLGAGAAAQTNKNGLADVRTNNLEAYRYYSLALEKAQAFHNTEAITLLEKAVALDPDFAMAYARIGYAYAVTGNDGEKGKPYLEKAFQLSLRLSDKDRLYISAWYAIANLDYQGAIRFLQEVTTEYPLESEAYFRLGRLLGGEERYEEAVSVLKQGLVIDPENRDIYNVLGSTYATLDKHDEAVAMHQRYVALAPDEPNAHDSLGLTYQWFGQYDLAMAEYNRALTLDPNFEIAIVHLGHAYAQLGQYHQAINLYRRYIEVAPSDQERIRGYRYIAIIYLKKGELDRAEEAAKKGTKYDKSHAWAPLTIAVEQGDPARAERLKEEFFAKWPSTNRGTKLPLRYLSYYDGRIALQSGRAPDAIQKFKETLRHTPIYWDSDSYEDCLANAYLELGQLEEAIAEYHRILQLNPNYPLAEYHLAQAYERRGLQPQAREAYRTFLEIWKDADADIPEVIAAQKRSQT